MLRQVNNAREEGGMNKVVEVRMNGVRVGRIALTPPVRRVERGPKCL